MPKSHTNEQSKAVDISPATLTLYRRLADGLSDMVEDGRLTSSDIPDDYDWLVEMLVKIATNDPA